MSRILFLLVAIISFKADAQHASALTVGDSLYQLGDYTKAIASYALLPSGEQQFLKLAISHEALGNSQTALKYYDSVLRKNPKAILAKTKYGSLLSSSGKLKEATHVFEELSEAMPQNPNFPYQLGLIYEKQKDTNALDYYKLAYAKDASHQNALYKLAKLHVEKRKFKTSEPLIEKGLKRDTNSIRFLTLSALKNYYLNNFHLAIQDYERLLGLKKGTQQMHEHLAFSFGKTNQYEKAIEQFTILINEFDDKRPSYHYNIGKSFLAIREVAKGRHHVELAIALHDVPLDDEYITLAASYHREGVYKEAMSLLEEALIENPKNEYALYQLAVTADNYFDDKKTVLTYYERYVKKFGDTANFSELAKVRIADIKKELHFSKD